MQRGGGDGGGRGVRPAGSTVVIIHDRTIVHLRWLRRRSMALIHTSEHRKKQQASWQRHLHIATRCSALLTPCCSSSLITDSTLDQALHDVKLRPQLARGTPDVTLVNKAAVAAAAVELGEPVAVQGRLLEDGCITLKEKDVFER